MQNYKSQLTWFVEDGDADLSVLIDVGVPDVGEDAELWRLQRILFGEEEVTLEKPALVQRVRRADYHYLNMGFV